MDFSKTKPYQRTRSCYRKLYAELYELKRKKRNLQPPEHVDPVDVIDVDDDDHSDYSSDDGHVLPEVVAVDWKMKIGAVETVVVTDDEDDDSERVIDLTNETDNLPFSEESNNNSYYLKDNDSVNEIGTENLVTEESVNVLNKGKHKLPFSFNVQEQEQKSDSPKGEAFMDSAYSVSKMLDAKVKGGGGVDVESYDTAKMRGITFPRPSWWPEDPKD